MSAFPEGNIDPKLIAEVDGAFIPEREMPLKVRREMAALAVQNQVAALDEQLEIQSKKFFNTSSAQDLGFSVDAFGITNASFLKFSRQMYLGQHEADAHEELSEADRELFSPIPKARLALLAATDGIQAAYNLSRRQAEKAIDASRKIR